MTGRTKTTSATRQAVTETYSDKWRTFTIKVNGKVWLTAEDAVISDTAVRALDAWLNRDVHRRVRHTGKAGRPTHELSDAEIVETWEHTGGKIRPGAAMLRVSRRRFRGELERLGLVAPIPVTECPDCGTAMVCPRCFQEIEPEYADE